MNRQTRQTDAHATLSPGPASQAWAEAWKFVVLYLPLVREDAPQCDYDLGYRPRHCDD